MSSQPALTQREQIAEDIIKFARDNNLKLHPGPDPLKWADLVIKHQGCPCVPGRNYCPCEFALEDIRELGRCRCGLFANDAYIDEYNRLRAKGKATKNPERVTPKARGEFLVNPKARGEFLKKISINGFAIEERDDMLILRPRGMEAEAGVIIKEVEPNVWSVAGAFGRYAGFARGKKRSYFETYINQWAVEAILLAQG